MASAYIESKLKLLPDLPGVYIYKNAEEEIIYIGKAKNLKNRVRSYFKSTQTGKTAKLVSEIVDFETIVTTTNKEALLLEVTLIKKHQPKYNIRLKSGTNYPYLKITNEDNPQMVIASEVLNDGAEYYGPYPNVYGAEQTLQILQKLYPLRRCNGPQSRACLYFHIGQCIGPCDHDVSKEEYDEQKAKIRSFLNGNVQEVKDDLLVKMEEASQNLDYERAAELRDQIRNIEETVEKQTIISRDNTPRDIFSFYMNKGWISIQVFFIRQRKLTKRKAHMAPCYGRPEEELARYILQYYDDPNNIKPKEILVPAGLEKEELADILQVPVRVPQRGEKKRLLDLAEKNAQIALSEHFQLQEMNEKKTLGASQELSQVLNIPYAERIEAFDHSNIQGSHPVSAMVSFKNGKADKKNYRKYHIKTVEGADEFATTQEVIRRRYSRLLKERAELPDLILMDGGKVQIHAALDVLENELSLHLPVAGIVKDDRHRTANLLVGHPDTGYQIVDLDPKSQAFYLVQRIQDEVHRFAITFHRTTRSKSSFFSQLDKIEGVGPKRRQKVMKHFRSLKNAARADVEEIKDLGIPEEVAVRIKESLAEQLTDKKSTS